MRLIVAGTRTFDDYPLLEERLNTFSGITEIISGNAAGADSLGERWANEHNIPIVMFKPDWKANGKAAGPLRNEAMAKYADAAIVFWDGLSRGTANMIDNCKKYELKYEVVKY
jgi:hypothetical protein